MPSRQHHCTMVEGEMPGYFTIICRCGWTSKTYWGEDDGRHKIDLHRFEHNELTPREVKRMDNA